MGIRTWYWALGIAVTLPIAGRAQSAADLTNLREDINGLTQRVSELTLRVEQLENAAAMARGGKPGGDVVTSVQLQSAVADLTSQMERLRATVPSAAATPPVGSARPEVALHPEPPSASPKAFSEDFLRRAEGRHAGLDRQEDRRQIPRYRQRQSTGGSLQDPHRPKAVYSRR